MKVSEGELANLVNQRLGQPLINDINSPSDPNAQALKKMIDLALREIINEADWTFSRRSFRPNLLNVKSPYPEFEKVYNQPPDVFGDMDIYADNTERLLQADEYRVEDKKIYSNGENLIVRYKRLPPLQDLSDYIMPALVELTAWKMSPIVSGEAQTIYWQSYQRLLARARRQNRKRIGNPRLGSRLASVREGGFIRERRY